MGESKWYVYFHSDSLLDISFKVSKVTNVVEYVVTVLVSTLCVFVLMPFRASFNIHSLMSVIRALDSRLSRTTHHQNPPSFFHRGLPSRQEIRRFFEACDQTDCEKATNKPTTTIVAKRKNHSSAFLSTCLQKLNKAGHSPLHPCYQTG